MFDGSLDDIPDEYRLTGGGEELENNGKIVVVVVEPGKEPRIEEIDSGLESLQGMVGGYIQAIYAIDFEQNVILSAASSFVAMLVQSKLLFAFVPPQADGNI